MAVMSESDDLDRLREQRRQELTDGADGEGADGEADAGGAGVGPSEPVHVDGAAALEETVNEYDVVLVDFYADWCGPCKMLEPIVKELAAETDVAVAKVDVDRNQQLAGQYQVQGVPTMMFFADGQPVERIVGVRGKEDLAGLISKLG
jgi:thioredoxin 1